MNKVFLIGRLTKDVETRYTQGENAMAISRFSIAVDRRKPQDNQTADFINCVAFSKTAEFIDKYFSKGSKIVIVGHIQTGSYTNKDNVKVYTTDVVVDECEFGESKGNATQTTPVAADNNGFMNIPEGIDEELPFN